MSAMKAMTKANIEAAFAGESQAHMKYTVYAEKAEREGFKFIARLFRAIAYAERVHASNHLRVLGKVSDTSSNLKDAAEGESFEVNEMYPAYGAVAELQKETAAMKSINYALEAEKIHERMYTDAKEQADRKQDIGDQPVRVCPVCGHTIIGDAPDHCPVCGLAKEKYITFS
jgi:rubrerythrin